MDKGITCPICNTANTEIFLNRLGVPVHQNFIFKESYEAKNIVRGDIKLAICKSCSFIFNSCFDFCKLEYGEFYDNTQTYSTYFQSYIEGIISYLIQKYDIMSKNIVEVGCGKGTFLREIVKATNGRGYGFDPSYVGPESVFDGKVMFDKRFYNSECSDINADVVICRHVIEHEANPINLLLAIRSALSNSPDALVFFETPNVEWILNNKIAYDIFYEHCSYFSNQSIRYLFERCGFKIREIRNEFNGQYMWVVATLNDDVYTEMRQYDNNDLFHKAVEYMESEEKIWSRWESKIGELGSSSAIWGAGAKGVTLLNAIDPNAEKIKCIIDINPNKAGGYLPGTGHRVIGYKDIPKYGLSNIIVLNFNYIQEIKSLLKQEGIKINLINGEEL